MSSLVNVISVFWMEQLNDCIIATMDEGQFRTFTLFEQDIVNFDDVRENKGFQQDLPIYLELLRKNGTLHILLKRFLFNNNVVNSAHPNFVAFKAEIEKVFDFTKDPTTAAITVSLNKKNFDSHLLRQNIFPFINRHNFRKQLSERLETNKAKVIFVNGEPRSGMSYLGKFLNDICDKTSLFEFYDIDVPYYLSSEELLNGVTLAKAIAAKFDFDDELEDERGDKFKFVRFANRLTQAIESHESTPILFLHDFHKIPVLDEINSLFFELLDLITKKMPNIVVIIAGFECENIRNWHSELKYLVKACDLDQITDLDVEYMLEIIFQEYQDKINALGQPMTKDVYIENMKAKLMPDQNIEIAVIGELLADHLYKLNE